MTREKAIDIFKCLAYHNLRPSEEEIDEAIKALEQKPCEDCISRQAVLDINESHHGQMPNHINHQIWQEIKDLPSVQPKTKTGKWVYGDHRCPCCGEDKFKDLDADIWADWFPKYCPNCGAKMESEVKE